MEQQPTQQQSIFLPILLTILITALITGLSVYYVTTQQPTPEPILTATTKPTATATLATTQPASSPTARVTKTYTNTTFNFSLAYPNDWKIIQDTIQKSKTAESAPSENLTIAPATATSTNYYEGQSLTFIVNHGGYGPEIAYANYTATYTNGKLVLSNKVVNTYADDVFQPEEGSFITHFTVDGVNYFMRTTGLTDEQFKTIAESFVLN